MTSSVIFKTTIHRDIIHLRDRIYETNFNRKRSDLITKSDDSIDMRRRIFSDDNDIRRQSKRYCFNQKFSISRTNQAHRYSNSLHQKDSDRRFHRLNLRVYRLNDSWRFDKIINQRQICSVSRRFKNRIIIFFQQSVWATTICENLSMSRDSNLWEFINASFFFFATVIYENQIMNQIFQWKLDQIRIWSHHLFLYNSRSLLNVEFAYKKWVRKKNFRL
jgi:hypothetical protein